MILVKLPHLISMYSYIFILEINFENHLAEIWPKMLVSLCIFLKSMFQVSLTSVYCKVVNTTACCQHCMSQFSSWKPVTAHCSVCRTKFHQLTPVFVFFPTPHAQHSQPVEVNFFFFTVRFQHIATSALLFVHSGVSEMLKAQNTGCRHLKHEDSFQVHNKGWKIFIFIDILLVLFTIVLLFLFNKSVWRNQSRYIFTFNKIQYSIKV